MTNQITTLNYPAELRSRKNVKAEASYQDVSNFKKAMQTEAIDKTSVFKLESSDKIDINSQVFEMMRGLGKKYNPISIKSNKEYGGYIYLEKNKLKNSKVFTSGKGDSVIIDMVEADKLKRNVIADWHTHGKASTAANVFSATDIISSNGFGNSSQFPNFQGSYLFSPDKHMTYYTSNTIPTSMVVPYQGVERTFEGEKLIAKDFISIGKDYGESW